MLDSDAYGVDTDSPVSAYEILDNALTLRQEKKITEAINDFIKEQAREFFATGTWDEEMWDAWKEKMSDLFWR